MFLFSRKKLSFCEKSGSLDKFQCYASAYVIYERYLIARNVEDADLAKDRALPQRHVDLPPVVRHHVQLASLDDVHLLTHITLSAHIVTRRENLVPHNQ